MTFFFADEVQDGSYRTGKFMSMEDFDVRADNRVHVQVHSAEENRLAHSLPRQIMSWPPGTHVNTYLMNQSYHRNQHRSISVNLTYPNIL
jgi:4-aminobutyrate aminotransferase-like enzyme